MPTRSILAHAVMFPAVSPSMPVEETAARILTSTKAGVRRSYGCAPAGVVVGCN